MRGNELDRWAVTRDFSFEQMQTFRGGVAAFLVLTLNEVAKLYGFPEWSAEDFQIRVRCTAGGLMLRVVGVPREPNSLPGYVAALTG